MHEVGTAVGRNRQTRRGFLENLGRVGGTAMLLAGMDMLGFGIGSAMAAPPKLDGKPRKNKVIVLGAGMAGLSAAYELNQAGYQVTVIEARSFPGGRSQTARRGVSLSELGGNAQTCNFDEGLYINHGPWRIPYHHQSTLHYTRKFGVPLEMLNNDNEQALLYYEQGGGPLRGKPVRKGAVLGDFVGHSTEILAKLSRQGALDDLLTAEDREKFVAFLADYGFLSRKDLTYSGSPGRGWEVNPGPGTDPGPGKPSTPYTLADLLRSEIGKPGPAGFPGLLHGVADWEQQRSMFQPIGGMDAIPRTIARHLPDGMIRFSTEVKRIRQTPRGITVDMMREGQPETIRADWCICTIPLSVLKGIDHGLSPAFKAAMDQCAYTPVGKIGLQMKRRFWEEDHHIYGGDVRTDNADINIIGLPSTGWQGQKGVLLGYYNFYANAAKISARSPADRAAVALDFGQKVFPAYKESYETSFSVAWHRVKYSLGGWADWSEEARATAYPVLCEPDGRIYLAGEHLSYMGGWQAGAIESAWQQIERLHARAMKG